MAGAVLHDVHYPARSRPLDQPSHVGSRTQGPPGSRATILVYQCPWCKPVNAGQRNWLVPRAACRVRCLCVCRATPAIAVTVYDDSMKHECLFDDGMAAFPHFHTNLLGDSTQQALALTGSRSPCGHPLGLFLHSRRRRTTCNTSSR